VKFEKQAR